MFRAPRQHRARKPVQAPSASDGWLPKAHQPSATASPAAAARYGLGAATLLSLQRHGGNHAVSRLVGSSGPPLQGSLVQRWTEEDEEDEEEELKDPAAAANELSGGGSDDEPEPGGGSDGAPSDDMDEPPDDGDATADMDPAEDLAEGPTPGEDTAPAEDLAPEDSVPAEEESEPPDADDSDEEPGPADEPASDEASAGAEGEAETEASDEAGEEAEGGTPILLPVSKSVPPMTLNGAFAEAKGAATDNPKGDLTIDSANYTDLKNGTTRVTGKATATFAANVTINLPSVPSNITSECEKTAYQNAIDTVLKAHEEKHKTLYEAFDGSIPSSFNEVGKTVKDGEDMPDVTAKVSAKLVDPPMDRSNAASRLAKAEKASAAIDPFTFDVDTSKCDEQNKKVK